MCTVFTQSQLNGLLKAKTEKKSKMYADVRRKNNSTYKRKPIRIDLTVL